MNLSQYFQKRNEGIFGLEQDFIQIIPKSHISQVNKPTVKYKIDKKP